MYLLFGYMDPEGLNPKLYLVVSRVEGFSVEGCRQSPIFLFIIKV